MLSLSKRSEPANGCTGVRSTEAMSDDDLSLGVPLNPKIQGSQLSCAAVLERVGLIPTSCVAGRPKEVHVATEFGCVALRPALEVSSAHRLPNDVGCWLLAERNTRPRLTKSIQVGLVGDPRLVLLWSDDGGGGSCGVRRRGGRGGGRCRGGIRTRRGHLCDRCHPQNQQVQIVKASFQTQILQGKAIALFCNAGSFVVVLSHPIQTVNKVGHVLRDRYVVLPGL
mmetsp:Transcript_159268/g.510990  ORF Transcript_159268/g.510990 Transcript_159268/m.510990 type:complete len:225 (-) Transcript_159268:1027-1701(-)